MYTNIDIKYLTEPHNGTIGKSWDDFEQRLLDVAAGKVDDRGWSLADCLNCVDEGGAAGPALPVGAGAAKAATALRRRQKESYGLVSKHELDTDFSEHIHRNFFQDGAAALAYLYVVRVWLVSQCVAVAYLILYTWMLREGEQSQSMGRVRNRLNETAGEAPGADPRKFAYLGFTAQSVSSLRAG